LVIDQVQTGMGRTGRFFAHQRDGIIPDVVTLAKGLGGGPPMGACLAIGPVAAQLTASLHGSTLGGNPVCAAAALAALRTLDDGGPPSLLQAALSHQTRRRGLALVDPSGVAMTEQNWADHLRGA
jgi:acetylornithine/N-succinyldiaminopimelate aminotransferase